MLIDERTIAEEMARCRLDVTRVGWFAARQPGMIRFLEQRLVEPSAHSSDRFGVALEGAWRICSLYEVAGGLPPPRIEHRDLTRAEAALHVAADVGERQLPLLAWVTAWVARPVILLDHADRLTVERALIAIVLALDEATSGVILRDSGGETHQKDAMGPLMR